MRRNISQKFWLFSTPLGPIVLAAVTLCAGAGPLKAQPPGNPQQVGNLPNIFAPVGGQQPNGLFAGPNAAAIPAQGAAANADFDSLIDLIQSTVSVETWAENGGGEAEIRPFPGGVFVDAGGMLRLRPAKTQDSNSATFADQLRTKAAPFSSPAQRSSTDPRVESGLRMVSLPRLEREIARRQQAGEPLEASMLTLAGLQRVKFVFVYPASGDVVLAGPAGDWHVNQTGQIVAKSTRQPVVRLDDLIVLLRRGDDAADSHFGCSINPRQDALAKTQAYLASSGAKPLAPGQRKMWLADLRDTLAAQDIEIFGVDPTSRVASILVEADYHMKLIGMGLADGVDGVQSYLSSVEAEMKRNGGSVSPMSVLRWWFALNYEAIHASPSRDAFELIGPGVRVLSENELLAEQGRRIHTGRSDELNRKFAEDFTTHFADLATHYPIYGELRNVFDLAMAVAIIDREKLAKRANWHGEVFANADRLQLPRGAVPRQVETVINHRVVQRTQIVAGVSGGVMVAPDDVLRESTRQANDLSPERKAGIKSSAQSAAWWWDAE